jgi:hypothetical protein
MIDADSVLWTLRNAFGYRMECLVRFAMGGMQVEILSEAAPVISRVFPNDAEALAWAEEERAAWTGRSG